ncbi:branched-chain amino acid ABC transporter ATP-binding protein/permease [Ramlibacter sp. USB13]|uniref:Branched-chain amino acid ABC transporter ATP-binding protein/permease n=1 Tax=Ramlibacter cellulosilyticus TaxID=2764187 RepID=A0A923MV80_9BURK|nr:branched-chain amino acid ABC transporter ATP-binding protein/permease [Ramlibacter cellulosilyticus]MBC5785264.1 branched-chain amino acid ABC transporter ATP-binding protein/permease [Ramlibacter cellulosilyticus]
MNKGIAAIVAAGAALATLPWLGLPPFYESILYLVCHWIVLAVSWNILSGYSGYFSFGHGAFFGIGMYASAVFAGKLGWPFLATLPMAALLPALLGLFIGFVVFRVKAVRGELFALLTLAVTFVVATIIINTPIDGGPGIYLNAVEVPHVGPSPASSLYLMILLAAVLTLVAACKVQGSKLGIGLFAIHDDEDVAEVMGVPTFRYKLLAFALSCALAGLAGGIHALFVSYVTVGETFNITVPLTVVLMSVLGGTRHWAGPAVGAAAITALQYFFTAGDHAVAGRAAVGAILVVVILFLPEGILGQVLKRRAAKRKDAPAPAPVAVPQAVVPTASVRPHPTAAPLLEVRGLSKAFKGVQALDGVDLQVRQGEILGLLGPNGSGKSTFINVVSGHYPLSAGRIVFDGQDLTGVPAHRMAHAGIARTYQIPRPFAHMTVLQNVAMVAMFGCASLDEKSAEREAWKWLEFTGLQGRAQALPDDLNLHQRKFLELARALAARPRLVLLDEVLSGLTPGEINEAIELIRRIRDQGATIVFVEHVMRAVMALTDRIVVLNHGKLIAQGHANEVMRDAQVVSAYLGKAAHA